MAVEQLRVITNVETLLIAGVSSNNVVVPVLVGSRGEQGLQGIQGIQGIQGVQGDPGATGSSGYLNYRLANTTDNPTVSDDVIFLTGASFTVNIPTAVGNTNKVFEFVHTGASHTQIYTLDPVGAETIDGYSTILLHTSRQRIRIISNGSSWRILDKQENTEWESFTPTGSWVSGTSIYTGRWRRRGHDLECIVRIGQTGVPTSATLLINIPFSLNIDTGVIINTTATTHLGEGEMLDFGTAAYPLKVAYNTATTVLVRCFNAAGTYAAATSVTQAVPIATIANGDIVYVVFRVPILEWRF
jgi:hypothetical protein